MKPINTIHNLSADEIVSAYSGPSWRCSRDAKYYFKAILFHINKLLPIDTNSLLFFGKTRQELNTYVGQCLQLPGPLLTRAIRDLDKALTKRFTLEKVDALTDELTKIKGLIERIVDGNEHLFPVAMAYKSISRPLGEPSFDLAISVGMIPEKYKGATGLESTRCAHHATIPWRLLKRATCEKNNAALKDELSSVASRIENLIHFELGNPHTPPTGSRADFPVLEQLNHQPFTIPLSHTYSFAPIGKLAILRMLSIFGELGMREVKGIRNCLAHIERDLVWERMWEMVHDNSYTILHELADELLKKKQRDSQKIQVLSNSVLKQLKSQLTLHDQQQLVATYHKGQCPKECLLNKIQENKGIKQDDLLGLVLTRKDRKRLIEWTKNHPTLSPEERCSRREKAIHLIENIDVPSSNKQDVETLIHNLPFLTEADMKSRLRTLGITSIQVWEEALKKIQARKKGRTPNNVDILEQIIRTLEEGVGHLIHQDDSTKLMAYFKENFEVALACELLAGFARGFASSLYKQVTKIHDPNYIHNQFLFESYLESITRVGNAVHHSYGKRSPHTFTFSTTLFNSTLISSLLRIHDRGRILRSCDTLRTIAHQDLLRS